MEWLPCMASCRRRIKSIISPPVVTLYPNRFQTREIIFLFTWRTWAHTAINHPLRRCTLIVAVVLFYFFTMWWPLWRAAMVRLVGFLISPSHRPCTLSFRGRHRRSSRNYRVWRRRRGQWIPRWQWWWLKCQSESRAREKELKKRGGEKKKPHQHQTLWKATLKAFSAESRLGFSCAPRLSSTKGLGGKHWQVEVWIIHTDWDQVLFPQLFEDESELKHLNRPFFPPFFGPCSRSCEFIFSTFA